MENLHVDLAFTAAAIGAGIASVGVLRAVEKHAIERARRRTKDILARAHLEGASSGGTMHETAKATTVPAGEAPGDAASSTVVEASSS